MGDLKTVDKSGETLIFDAESGEVVKAKKALESIAE